MRLFNHTNTDLDCDNLWAEQNQSQLDLAPPKAGLAG